MEPVGEPLTEARVSGKNCVPNWQFKIDTGLPKSCENAW